MNGETIHLSSYIAEDEILVTCNLDDAANFSVSRVHAYKSWKLIIQNSESEPEDRHPRDQLCIAHYDRSVRGCEPQCHVLIYPESK